LIDSGGGPDGPPGMDGGSATGRAGEKPGDIYSDAGRRGEAQHTATA